MNKAEPSTFFFDKKTPSYYKNQSLNNCKTRTRYSDRLYNALINCKSIIEQLQTLEENKDFYLSKNKEIYNIKEDIDNIINQLENYRNIISDEAQELNSRDFEKIAEENIARIRASENEKECHEIYQ